MLSDAVAVLPSASVSFTTKLYGTPLAFDESVAVPEIAPVVEFSVKPDGSVPCEIDHVYGALPPVAESELLRPRAPPYDDPAVASSSEVVRIDGKATIDRSKLR